MNVAYDIFLKDPELAQSVSKQPDLDAFFGELYDFVKQRLKPLEGEINNAERSNLGENLVTIIVMDPPPDQPNMRLWFEGYSQELVSRMKGCFSDGDFSFILQKIQGIWNRLNN